ncbi:NAD(P)/FAD-dependent oxidoreductase [Actinokineospora terrae]|uniref:NADH:ubiquinone reductase (non-electrogenic) n=1 Tax=Actinokineospora terrae TaxID=155974 RepID=A0A1H9XRF6_9PSEU|nr:NAD(P)/FAD-dependent oxidoreductase [Actinokineospora terrae]SES48711.1 NADH dehydrogenase [Actinokineospora terrae]
MTAIIDRPGARHRVVVVGAGFGGLNAARGLRRADTEVVVVDRVNHHLFQPLLYQVATAILPPGDIAPALREVLGENYRVILGEATDVDAGNRIVDVIQADGSIRKLGYDSLVVAVGSTDSYFGNDGWRQWAPPMKTLDDAVNLRGRILRAFERAAIATDEATRRREMTFAIVGAGPTGVELAGQIAAMRRRTLRGQYPELNLDDVRVVLLDALDSVLPPYTESLRDHTERKLRELGVDVRLGMKVQDVDDQGIVYAPSDGGPTERLDAATVVWAAGVRAAPLTGKLAASAGVETDKKGRLVVQEDCTVPGHPEVFVIGDTANHNDLPGVAETALQQGKYVAKAIRARLTGEKITPFRYLDLGTMATISAGDAVADVRGLHLRGLIGKVAWAVVHLAFLVGWRNRAAVLAGWAWTVGTGRRTQRVILEPVAS